MVVRCRLSSSTATSTPPLLAAMPLSPILTHFFPHPLPYLRTLAAQNKIHAIQLEQRQTDRVNTPDVMLLLEHRPVYTAGRRQKVEDLLTERSRLEGIGADWVQTDRGGQTTYHGPGQLTAYPLLDLGRMQVRVGSSPPVPHFIPHTASRPRLHLQT